VDETDIGKIKLGQEAVIILDAYPGQRIPGRVEHIYYESKTVNNVTIYEVDIIPDTVPGFFRSGMNASIECVVSRSERALLVPQEAVMTDKDGSWVLVKDPGAREPARRSVKRGISDDKNVEIISGLHEKEVLVVRSKKYALPKTEGGTNPFAPRRR
jgi:membrane fusion protein, macrolide-specific efflux system